MISALLVLTVFIQLLAFMQTIGFFLVAKLRAPILLLHQSWEMIP